MHPKRPLRWAIPAGAAVAAIVAILALYLVVGKPDRPAVQPGADIGSPSIADGSLWEVAFTQPLIPDDRSKHTGGVETRLMSLMDGAARTLDVAAYDFDLRNIADAMARAARRGVRVRMVTDTSTLENAREPAVQAALRIVGSAGISVIGDGRRAFMHNKFTVVDGEWVQTGSWNYTDGDTYRLNNNLAIFRSRELAANYTAEFEKMFVQKTFGPSKVKGVPYPSLAIADLSLESYFPPQDGVASRLVDRIMQAQQKVHFLAFSFTHDAIGNAMLARARAGVEVQGVFETTDSDTQFSEYGKLKQAGLDVLTDGSPYFMHHKVILLDDRVTIFGSFNFSNNADRENDENLLIVDSPRFTALFEAEFQRVRALAKSPLGR